MAGIFFLNLSISKAEASRVTPVVFSVVPIASYFISFVVDGEGLSSLQLAGVFLLIFGGLLISFDLPLKVHPRTFKLFKKILRFSFLENILLSPESAGVNKKRFFTGFYSSCIAGILLAISYVMFKQVYLEQSFFNGFMWTRIGGFLFVIFLLLVPSWRKSIFRSFSHAKKPSRRHFSTSGFFIVNKVMGGLSSILLNKAFQLGSVTLVNSMVSLQYVFVLILVAIAAKKRPQIFEEKLLFWDWTQKIMAIVIIAIGMFFVSK
jgi:drug/metabolite transporter (DMT)-like permease